MRFLVRSAGIAFLSIVSAFVSPSRAAEPCPTDQHLPIGYSILPDHPCDGDTIALRVSACAPCVQLISVTTTPRLQVTARMSTRGCMTRLCRPQVIVAPLGRFRAGRYHFTIGVQAEVADSDSVAVCTAAYADTLGFSVAPCVGIGGGLPFVNDIMVGQHVVCITTPCPDLACPGDSIPVLVRGTFPDDCHFLKRIEVLPKITTDIGPPPIRIVIDDGGCLGRPCVLQPTLWSGKLQLPPLPPGDYVLPIQVAVTNCSDSIPPDSLHFGRASFRVVPFGSPPCAVPPPSCFRVLWEGREAAGDCHAVIAPGVRATLDLEIGPTQVPLAGLQGELVLDPAGVRIADLAATGVARDMHLQWTRTEHGARFVLFADHGAPIPVPPPPDSTDRRSGVTPVLAVTVEPVPGGRLAERTALYATGLIGSDSTGGRVDPCPDQRPVAAICSATRCDMNGDGVADVRDLVLMVHCVQGTGYCPPGVVVDCNGDGQTQLEDVLCCARVILHGAGSDTSGSRPEPGIHVDLGDVTRTGDAFELPIAVRGADRMGAARLALGYPADRFDVTGVDVDASSDWLSLSDVRGGRVVVGLISTGSDGLRAALGEIHMTLRLALKPGAVPSGSVALLEGEFSGNDGVGLRVDLGQPSRLLGSGVALSVSASQPNPFSTTTRFSVVLETSGTLDVAVYDLAGRRVTSLFQGTVPAGTRDLTWDGHRADGRITANGVYFLRATMSGQVVSRRIVRMKN
jgi:hypothetical protein